MYKNNLSASIVVLGKAVQEDPKGIVKLPFDTEYKLRIHNYNITRAVVDIEIDGKSAFKGLVVNPGSYVDVERYSDIARKFKFAKLDAQAASTRLNSTEDGTVTIRYQFELYKQYTIPLVRKFTPLDYYVEPWGYKKTTISYTDAPPQDIAYCSLDANTHYTPGYTKPGESSAQQVGTTYVGALSAEVNVIQLSLIGYEGASDTLVEHVAPQGTICHECGAYVYVAYKYCANCGTKAPKVKPYKDICTCGRSRQTSDEKFCPECGLDLKV